VLSRGRGSGRVVRHRLNRGGDRQLNRALRIIVMIRERYHEPTRRYVARRTAEGKSEREIRRCLKRTVGRQLYRLLARTTAANPVTKPEPPPWLGVAAIPPQRRYTLGRSPRTAATVKPSKTAWHPERIEVHKLS
jgi:hypothetical protein